MSADQCTCTEDTRDESCPFHSPGSMTQPKQKGPTVNVKLDFDVDEFRQQLGEAREAMEGMEKAFLHLLDVIKVNHKELVTLRDEMKRQDLLP